MRGGGGIAGRDAFQSVRSRGWGGDGGGFFGESVRVVVFSNSFVVVFQIHLD